MTCYIIRSLTMQTQSTSTLYCSLISNPHTDARHERQVRDSNLAVPWKEKDEKKNHPLEMGCTCWVRVSLPLHCLRCPRPLLLPPYWLGLIFSLDLLASPNALLSSFSLNRDADEDVEMGSSGERTEFSRLSFSPPFDRSSQCLVSSTIFSKTRKVSSVCPVSLTTRSTTSCW